MSTFKSTAQPGALDFTIEREFDAPTGRVFRAHVEPKAISLWWGPSWLTTKVDRLEPRKGGVCRRLDDE